MKMWYSFEFNKFCLSPYGWSINKETDQDFVDNVDDESLRYYIECQDVDVDENYPFTIYVYWSLDEGEVFTDNIKFKDIIEEYKLDCIKYNNGKENYVKENKIYSFNEYIIEEIKHIFDSDIYSCGWYILETKWTKNNNK